MSHSFRERDTIENIRMKNGKQHPGLLAGIFVLLGLGLVSWLTIQFAGSRGAGGDGYPVFVEIDDASGVRTGVPVRIGGVEIGHVASDPDLTDSFARLLLELRIDPGRKIPANSQVRVATSGLMGDSFVRIIPPSQPSREFVEEGSTIVAKSAESISDLTGNAGEALEEAREAIKEIRGLVSQLDGFFTRIEDGVLTDENLENVKVTLSELRESSEQINRASGNIEPLFESVESALENIDGAAGQAKETFDLANKTLVNLRNTVKTVDPVATELDSTLDDLRATLNTADRLIHEIETGDGLANALVHNSKLREDLESFVEKLDRNGVLFYPRENGLFQKNPEKTEDPAREEPPEDGKKKPFSWLKKKNP